MGNAENSEIAKAFGAVLREARTSRGLTQEELAFNAQVDRTFIYRLEGGIRQPTISTIFRLAEALDVSVEFLAGQTQKKYSERPLARA